MSKLNKLVTNYPVQLTNEEVENLSLTLSAVRTSGGGGGEGKTYHGEGFVSVNNTNNSISLTTEANEKLNQPIPTKVSDLSDSANYQTVAGMDEYLTTANAQTLYQTKEAMSAYATIEWTNDNFISEQELAGSVVPIVEAAGFAYKSYVDGELNKKENKLTFAYDNDKISAINGSAFAGQGGVTYSAGQYINIDSNDTISVTGLMALDEYAQYEPVLIGDSNITATSSKVDSHTQWNLAINATPVVTNTKLTGQNCVTAHTTQVSGEWAVGLVQSAYEAIDSIAGISTDVGTLKTASAGWDKVSDKLDTTAFSTVSGTFLTEIPDTYATKDYANNASANALSEAETWVGQQGYLTSVPDTYALKTDIPTTVAQLTDSGNYYQKTETSSKGELSAEFAKYVTSSNVTTQDTDYVMTTSGWKVLSLPGGGMTQVIHDDTLTGQGNADNSKLGVVWSALSGNTIYSALSAGSATSAYKAASASAAKRLQDSTTGPSIQVGDVTALQNWASSNSSTWDSVTAKLTTAQYATDSATFVTKPDTTQTVLNNNYLIYSTLTDPTATTGWMPLSANYYSKTEADGRYQKKEDMSNYLTTAKYETDSATFVTSSSNTITGTKQYALTTTGWSDIELSAYLPLSGGTVSGQLEVHGGSNFDSQFIKLTREGNSCGARIGLGSDTTNGTLALKTFNGQGQNTVQVNIKHNTNNNELIQVQKGGSDVGFLIPAVTATTTAGLTNDGILHIILES